MSDRHTLIPAAYIFLEKEGKYLFLRRANSGYYDGYYQVPAGHVEANETPTEAIVREAKEEVGVEINPVDLKFVHAVYRADQDKTGLRIDFFFMTSKWSGEAYNAEPSKSDDVQWFTPDELPENIVPLMREVLNSIGHKNYLLETFV